MRPGEGAGERQKDTGLGPVPSTQVLLVKSQTTQANLLPNRFAMGSQQEAGSGYWVQATCLFLSARVYSLTLALNGLQSPHLGSGSTPQTPPAPLCQDDLMSTPSPHLERHGATPGQPGPPYQPRTLSGLRAGPHMCLQSIELDLGVRQGQAGQAEKSHLADLSPSHPPP